jgi:hypothetical protein
MKRNVSEHRYIDADEKEEGDNAFFEVYQNDQGWFWEFVPHYRDAGPFKTEAEAITAGEHFLDEKGEPYIK